MSVTTESPRASFRIDMLWNDSRYRSTFLQIIALFVFFTVLFLLVGNVRDNLAALGKEFGFEFMTTPSSYDINQQPIEYTSRDSHARAAVVGIINTLLVAGLGCVLATVIGVLAGVARLSHNWIVAKLMTVYVEVVRNIPVLIQILLFSAIITEALPAPREFRGENATASMWLWDSVAATNRGVYIPKPIWEDGSFLVIAALVIGIILAVWFGRHATRRQQQTGEILPTFPVQAGLIVGLPAVVFAALAIAAVSGAQICLEPTVALLDDAGSPLLDAAGNELKRCAVPIWLQLPYLRGFNFTDGLHMRESYVSLTLALSIYHGVFIAENVRAGIQSVSKGQTEASYALGLQPGRTMSLVILPQALRVIIPPLISHYLNLTKNSSLALLVGYMDATGTLGGITLNQTGREFETLALLMAFYLSVSLSIAAVMNLYNQNTQLVERTSAIGMGFSFLSVFDSYTGNWELLKRGDAKMHDGYGIRGLLNLYVVFYAVVLLLLLNYQFIQRISDIRPSYFDWSTPIQLVALGQLIFAFFALSTCLFKSARFVDMCALELIVFLMAVVLGFPFGQLTEWLNDVVIVVVGYPIRFHSLSGATVIVAGLAIRLAILGYTMFGERSNLTFFNRVRRAES